MSLSVDLVEAIRRLMKGNPDTGGMDGCKEQDAFISKFSTCTGCYA